MANSKASKATVETLYFASMPSPIGPLALVCSDKGLVSLEMNHSGARDDLRPRKKVAGAQWVHSEEKLAPYRRQLEEYFAGKRQAFSIPLDLRGAEFHKACWRSLLKVPYGKTASYAEIARMVGSPRAFRAVGQANHNNPVAVIVPCHRIIAADGTLGGYGGGLHVKEKLLELEGVTLRRVGQKSKARVAAA